MTKQNDIDTVRFNFANPDDFQRAVERAVNEFIRKNNSENSHVLDWFIGG
jgi:hypothetical protein